MAHRHEDLSPTPSIHVKSWAWWHIEIRRIPETSWPARLVGSRIRKTLPENKKMERS